MSSIFTKIIQGEIPCYKIYEDDKTFAFLDIEPEAPGHTLVVPKVEVDKVYDLSDADYTAVMATVKKLAQHYENILGKRIIIKIIGIDVPHAHVHLIPVSNNINGTEHIQLTPTEMESIRTKLEYKN